MSRKLVLFLLTPLMMALTSGCRESGVQLPLPTPEATEAPEAAGKETQRSRTSLGQPMAWPAGFDPGRIASLAYSPTGRYLAVGFGGSTGVAVVDLSTRQVTDFSTRFRDQQRPQLQCGWPSWTADTHLLMTEYWLEPDQRERLRIHREAMERQDWETMKRHHWEFDYAWRVVDVVTGETLFYREAGRRPVRYIVTPADTRWYVIVPPGEVSDLYEYAADLDRLGERVFTWDRRVDFFLYGASGTPWVSKALNVKNTEDEWPDAGAPAAIECLNLETRESLRLTDFPLPDLGVGPFITADGRWAASAYQNWRSREWVPVVMETATRRRLALPGESWAPVAMSEARGTLLVETWENVPGQDEPRREWFEIPLSALLR